MISIILYFCASQFTVLPIAHDHTITVLDLSGAKLKTPKIFENSIKIGNPLNGSYNNKGCHVQLQFFIIFYHLYLIFVCYPIFDL